MAIYIVRLRDGSSIICEASGEYDVRSRLQEGEGRTTIDSDEIATIRELAPNTYRSRWWVETRSEEPIENRTMMGGLDDDLESDIFDHEYPMVAAAHKYAADDEPVVPNDLPTDTPVLDPRVMTQMNKWQRNLQIRLAQSRTNASARSRTSQVTNIEACELRQNKNIVDQQEFSSMIISRKGIVT